MSEHLTAREAHALHEDERNRHAQLARVHAHEAEIRRLLDERWQRRMLPLLASVDERPSDFKGCVW